MLKKMMVKLTARKLLLIFLDILCYCSVIIVYSLISHFATFGNHITDIFSFIYEASLLCVAIELSRGVFGIYSTVWRYTNTAAYLSMVLADFTAGIFSLLIMRFIPHTMGMWFYVTVCSLNALMALSERFCYMIIYRRSEIKSCAAQPGKINIAIVGAGHIGVALAQNLETNPKTTYHPVCFFDINHNKIGNYVCGIKIYSDKDAEKIIAKFGISEIIVTVSDVNESKESYYEYYAKFGCKVKIYELPRFSDANASDTAFKGMIRDFKIEDLLSRNQIDITETSIFEFYRGKRILVTGGGGSIGSELCRQIAKCNPEKLIIFDIYENNAYDIQQELIQEYGKKLDLSIEIGSVRDRVRLDMLFKEYKPDIVLHAAAHKHVPLMEKSCAEAIKNNVFGTYNTADIAEKYNVSKFILISTDKAVNPTNVMGASKRLCEMIIQCRNDSNTVFSAVRFGNVLGSNGSVIPLFKRQVAAGGPVTITDKRIIRYFMTIPEAAQLVITAGAMASCGELFVLDMGKPVKIYNLAENIIRLSGFTPGKDIEIKEIGLRPGEKLYEELLIKSETLTKTDNSLIFIEKDIPLSRAEIEEKLAILSEAVSNSERMNNQSLIKEAIKATVSTYHEASEVNIDAEKIISKQLDEKIAIN